MNLFNGDCLEVLKQIEDECADSVVTDPPAGISFMGKEWDDDKGGRDHWIKWMTEVMTETMRVLKPGAHGLVWALPRTSHWTATALENAGFEVRDVVTHLFGTGFPKSMDIEKAITKAGQDGSEFKGFGTALKPASEHWILVRKPCSEKTVAANVLKHGTGGINIDGSRIKGAQAEGDSTGGRFPANLVLDEEAASALDEQSGILAPGNHPAKRAGMGYHGGSGTTGVRIPTESGGASRFFYVAKASKSDKGDGNTHPTVKSRALMAYLIKLVTPPGGVVLDPFMGSGSTGVAAVENGFTFAGVEKDPAYFAIAQKRIEEATNSSCALLAKE